MNTVVGVIGRPHGVRGEVVVELRTDEPERRFAPGQVLREEGGTRHFTVRSVRQHSGRLLVRFAESGRSDRGRSRTRHASERCRASRTSGQPNRVSSTTGS